MGNGEDPAGLRDFVAGGVGGMAFVAVGQPFDTIKVRMQNQARGRLYKSSIDCLYKTVSREGVLALCKGMATPLAAAGGSSALWFLGHSHAITIQQKLFGREEMSIWNHGMGGLLAGMYMIILLAPGERVKCILQMQTDRRKKAGIGKYKGPMDVIRKTFKEGGIRQLYKGTIATGLRDVPGSGIFYVIYESSLRRYGRSPTTEFVAAGVAGIGMWFVGVPADVVKTRFQTAPEGKYRSFLQIIPELYKSEGFQGFYKGFGPSGLRAFFANGICLFTYERVMKTWQKSWPLETVTVARNY